MDELITKSFLLQDVSPFVSQGHLLCATWFACSTVHFLKLGTFFKINSWRTEFENEEFIWGVDPGYHRYVSIPSAMYYAAGQCVEQKSSKALIDFNGEFPNADEFSAPFGRMNSMVICLLGTYVLSIPAGVLGAAFHDTWTCYIDLLAAASRGSRRQESSTARFRSKDAGAFGNQKGSKKCRRPLKLDSSRGIQCSSQGSSLSLWCFQQATSSCSPLCTNSRFDQVTPQDSSILKVPGNGKSLRRVDTSTSSWRCPSLRAGLGNFSGWSCWAEAAQFFKTSGARNVRHYITSFGHVVW